jgi:DtxR family transcriptional regulator, Mn-dependent transcriptional regulator
MYSYTEENYLKAIFHLSNFGKGEVSTNAIADSLHTKAASVSDMLKKLALKELVNYQKYQGVSLTDQGLKVATNIVRKHRLWEVFLVKKLNFNWDEIHDVAEELEHISSQLLIDRLDDFLENPRFDPHGDPIPSKDGKFQALTQTVLVEREIGEKLIVTGVRQHSSAFLKYLDKINIGLGTQIEILDKVEYDSSLELLINGKNKQIVSKEVSGNVFVS